MKVVDNLQVFVDKIHIRYEDSTSNPNHPFAFGITLGGLHAQSTDVDWKPTFLTVGDILMRKVFAVF
jgi:vacuolar protein sorting-associated protein 13A/C